MKADVPTAAAYLAVWATFIVPLGGFSLWLADRARDDTVRLEQGVTAMDGRLTAMEGRLTAQIRGVEDRQKERLADLEARLRAEVRPLADQVATVTNRLHGVSNRLSEVAADTANIKGFLAAVQAVQRGAARDTATTKPKVKQ